MISFAVTAVMGGLNLTAEKRGLDVKILNAAGDEKEELKGQREALDAKSEKITKAIGWTWKAIWLAACLVLFFGSTLLF